MRRRVVLLRQVHKKNKYIKFITGVWSSRTGIGIKLVRNFADGAVDYRLLITEDKLHIPGLIMVLGVKDTRRGGGESISGLLYLYLIRRRDSVESRG